MLPETRNHGIQYYLGSPVLPRDNDFGPQAQQHGHNAGTEEEAGREDHHDGLAWFDVYGVGGTHGGHEAGNFGELVCRDTAIGERLLRYCVDILGGELDELGEDTIPSVIGGQLELRRSLSAVISWCGNW